MNRPVPTVAAIHDISGVGRCALTVAMPIISAMGAQVCPAVTAVLSAHTGFPDVEMQDLTEFLGRTFAAWARMGLKFDTVYTGYLGSPKQARLIARFMDDQKGALKIVDPVMGDDGKLYPGITGEMADEMRALCEIADIITPNMTEYAALTGEEYSNAPRTEDEIRGMLNKLKSRSAVITSVPVAGGLVNACRLPDGQVCIIPFESVSCHYPGTGDIFASVLTGAMTRGERLDSAVHRAAEYVRRTIEVSKDIRMDVNFGVQLEATLPILMGGEI